MKSEIKADQNRGKFTSKFRIILPKLKAINILGSDGLETLGKMNDLSILIKKSLENPNINSK